MTPEEQIVYLASWRHAHLCAQFAFRRAVRPPDHSWLDCPKMARFWWAAGKTVDPVLGPPAPPTFANGDPYIIGVHGPAPLPIRRAASTKSAGLEGER